MHFKLLRSSKRNQRSRYIRTCTLKLNARSLTRQSIYMLRLCSVHQRFFSEDILEVRICGFMPCLLVRDVHYANTQGVFRRFLIRRFVMSGPFVQARRCRTALARPQFHHRFSKSLDNMTLTRLSCDKTLRLRPRRPWCKSGTQISLAF